MKKYLILALLCLMSIASANAQDGKRGAEEQKGADVLKESVNAPKSIDSLTKLTNTLKKEKETIEKSLKDSTQKIEALSREIAKLNNQINAQKKNIDDSNFKKAELLKPYQDSLKLKDSIILSYKNQIGQQKEVGAGQNSEIANLKKQLADLNAFKSLYTKAQIEEKKPYLDLPYSQMDIAKLQEVISMCEELNSAELNVLKNNFTSALQRKELYDKCEKSINNAFDETKINDLLSSSTSLIERSNEAQQPEVTALVAKMKSYSDAQRFFTMMIQWIANYMKDYRAEGIDINTAIKGAEDVFGFERIKLWHERFAPIPYLEKLFEEYKKQLLEKPTEAPQIELDTLK